VDATVEPRFAGLTTFFRLPTREQVAAWDVGVVGIPFDAGTSYRPGARFGPSAVRQGSRLLRTYHPDLEVSPFAAVQVVDAGDIACTPFNIETAVVQIEAAADRLLTEGSRLVAVGGDHTVALPLLRSVVRRHGPVALVHFDAHLDTWDTYFDARYTRGPLYSAADLDDDDAMRFWRVSAVEVGDRGVASVVEGLRARIGTAPVYVSVDIDVLDPAHAPGTGTPEAGGLTSRELLALLRGLDGLDLVGGDVVEVAPAYDHAEITANAAAHVAFDLVSLLARRLTVGATP
jgi:agmatinase